MSNFAILLILQLLDLLLKPLRLLVFVLDHGLDLRLGVALQLCLIVDDVAAKLNDFLLFVIHEVVLALALLFGGLDELFQSPDGHLQIFVVLLQDLDFLGGPRIGLQLERIHDEAAAAIDTLIDRIAEALGQALLGKLAAEVGAIVE